MRSEFGVEEGYTFFKRGNALSEAVSGRATYTTAAAILYASLAAGFLREEGCPQRRVSVNDVIRYCTHGYVVTVIEGSAPVVNKKGVPAAVCGQDIVGTPCKASGHHVRLLSRCSGAIEITGVIIVGGA